MTGTAVGQMAAAVRFTTTTMFTCPIRRSHHAAIILQDLRLQTVPGESAGPGQRVGRGELADLGQSADRGELADQAVSGVPGELAGLGESAGILVLTLSAGRVPPTGWQDHPLGHTIHQPPGRTRAAIGT